jgi:hypothetical protein
MGKTTNPWGQRSGSPAPAKAAAPKPSPKPGHIRLTVTNDGDAKPVRSARVKLTGPSASNTRTSAAGVAEFPGLDAGAYTIEVAAEGLVGETASVNVSEGKTTAAAVRLKVPTCKLAVAGVADAKKVTEGGLLVRDFDGNRAPRRKLTIGKCEPAAFSGHVLLRCASPKVKFFRVASGGTAVALDGAKNRFATGSLPADLWVQGTDPSDSMRDIEVSLDIDGGAVKVDFAKLTVLWVEQPNLKLSGDMNANNSKRGTYKGWTKDGLGKLGLQEYNNNCGARMGWGSEASAKVHPPDFSFPGSDLKLERDYDFNDFRGNVVSAHGAPNAVIPPGNDSGDPPFRDDDPEPDGTIYDFDAAGLPVPAEPQNTVFRTRNNFRAFASITLDGKKLRCSQVRDYFICFSQKQAKAGGGSEWHVIDPPDIPGDKQAGHGTTKTTWDLK